MSSIRVHATALAAAALLTCTGAGAATASSAVGRFSDGGYEYPTVPTTGFTTFSAGQSLGPWNVDSGSVDLVGSGYWQAAEGVQSVDLNGTGPGSVAQTFSTVPGATYTVTYKLAGNTDSRTPLVKTGTVLIDGQDFQRFSFDVTGKTRTDMGYVTRRLTFVANSSATKLTFASTTAESAQGPVIDDVQVSGNCCSCGAGC